ncbi:MAG: hypothetical protein AAF658_05235, partial [Myxococcota bacterium]
MKSRLRAKKPAVPRQLAASLGLLSIIGCLSDPVTGGQSLVCGGAPEAADAQCVERFGEGWRCLQSGCVLNESPRIQGFTIDGAGTPSSGPFFVTEPNTFTLNVVGQDSDGDEVTFSWVATESPAQDPSSADPFSGAELTRSSTTAETPLALGTYSYRVTPSDSRVNGASRTISVVVQSSDEVIFVSQLGEDTTGCGTIQLPCESLERALTENGSGMRVQLAAGPAPYDYCLGRQAPAMETSPGILNPIPLNIEGCFDPETWEPSPARRRECRIECAAVEVPSEPALDLFGLGHTLVGPTTLSNVTLALSVDELSDGVTAAATVVAGPADEQSSDGFDRIVLRDVDVIGPACGGACFSVALGASDADLDFRGVNVSADADGFDTVSSFLGMSIERSRGQIVGGLAGGAVPIPETAAERGELIESQRGVLTLNAPAIGLAFGLELTEFSGTVDGIIVSGGLGLTISGIQVNGGTPTISNSLVDVVGFGSRGIVGIDVYDCDVVDNGCSDTPVNSGLARVNAFNNSVFLGGASDFIASAPCVGLGLQLASQGVQHRIEGNRFVLSDEFTLAAGSVLDVGPADDRETTEATFSGNTLDLAGATNDLICILINSSEQLPVNAGLIGLRAEGSTHLRISDNTLTVGEQTTTTSTPQAADDLRSVGLSLANANDSATRFMRVERNSVQMGAGVVDSVAATSDVSRIDWVNNLLYGGDAPRATGFELTTGGLNVSTIATTSELPRLRHNTIVGGGFVGRTASTRGVSIQTPNDALKNNLTRVGTLVGNVVDAGRGLGRRFIFDNERVSPVVALAFDAQSAPMRNYGQFSGTPAQSQPVLPVVTFTDELFGRSTVRWRTLGASGETLVWQRNNSATLSLIRDDGVGVVPLRYASRRISSDTVAVVVAGLRDFVEVLQHHHA